MNKDKLSDHVGAKLIYAAMPDAKARIGDTGHDSDGLRAAPKASKVRAGVSSLPSRSTPGNYSKTLYGQRQRIESMFVTLMSWRRFATR
ncbi:hypothetical protein [Kaistia adipata]|uniref:hypothetical protein n=1 Tax=Kaistia adipata TaxID=166954 RepID=UPI0012EC51E4|nr:hypothetical protein [Kaistia adipata]